MQLTRNCVEGVILKSLLVQAPSFCQIYTRAQGIKLETPQIRQQQQIAIAILIPPSLGGVEVGIPDYLNL